MSLWCPDGFLFNNLLCSTPILHSGLCIVARILL
jgi:hypothetical protein